MVAAQQLGHADERLVGQRPVGVGLDRGLARDVGKDLAALLVDPEKARSAVEAHVLEVREQGVDRGARRPLRPPHGVPHARDPARVGGAAEQEHLSVGHPPPHARASSSVASDVCVTRLVAMPPRTAASTAPAFDIP